MMIDGRICLHHLRHVGVSLSSALLAWVRVPIPFTSTV